MMFPETALLLLAWWACIRHVVGQNTNPSNDTFGAQVPAAGTPQLVMKYTSQSTMISQVNIDPLTGAAGLGNTVQQLQGVDITGHLVLANALTANSVSNGDIAYISCDASSYPGDLGAAGTVNLAASKAPNAILLYSTTSKFCTFDTTGDFVYNIVYSMQDPNASLTLQNGLKTSGPSNAQATIILDQTSLGKNATGANALGPSPTTAVAMIILYSITGIITALFLIIIVTGAVRAHRHPERYGPRQIIGRPRQSRAKGIARAMLETLPIVKFGDKEEENKPVPSEGDVEMGTTAGTEAASGKAESTRLDGASDNPREIENPDVVTTVAAEGTADQPQKQDAQGKEIPNTENGLACSVCTDDFIKGQDIRLLPCKHKFHPECIDPWLLNVSGTCPLCRVDLRAPTSVGAEDGIEATDAQSVNGDDTLSSTTNMSMHVRPYERRRSNGLALYFQHTLNARRMRNATAEERIQALRRLRTVNRANEGQPGEDVAAGGERSRNRFSQRLSRVFGGSPTVAIGSQEQVPQVLATDTSSQPAETSPEVHTGYEPRPNDTVA